MAMSRVACCTKPENCTKTREFKLYAPQANNVKIAGNFNNWDANSICAKKDSRGNWLAKVNLKPGKYEYKFIVDGNWMNDPKCGRNSPNPFGSQNSIVEIR